MTSTTRSSHTILRDVPNRSGRIRQICVRHATTALCACALFCVGCCLDPRRTPAGSENQQPHIVLRTPLPASGTGAQIEAAATAPEDGQWTRPAKDYAGSRFSGLNEINTGNVASLKPAWTFPTGVLRGQEAAPIVVGHTMYVVTPYPNLLYAFDL